VKRLILPCDCPRLRVLEFRKLILELCIAVNRTGVGLLKRGYLSCDEGNQAHHFVLWCNAVINHPLEVIEVLLEWYHDDWRMTA